jgi:hypothetical protein
MSDSSMVLRDHKWFTPSVQVEPEILEIYRTTHQFYDEVQHREALDRYCDWYYSVAEQNRRELEKMRGDINLFGWFARKR